MTVSLLKVVADLNLSLAAAVSVGATTATLQTSIDRDDVALVSGKYGFTIDGDNSAKEFIICDLVGTALTNVQHVSVQGAVTSGFSNYHRVGAVVTITDWAILSRILNNLTGATGFDAGNPLNYDAEPSYADPLTIPTVQFVLDTASGGAVTFDATVIAAVAGETIVDGDWVYFNTTDGEWYKTDADDTAKCLGVRIGKARGAGTDGNAITGGVFVAGLEKVGTYVAGTTYYISNTAGALSTSAGTNSVVVGVGDANGDLILRQPTPNQTDAMQGDATPTGINRFLTKGKLMTAGATITGATLPVPVYQNKTDNEFYACDANDNNATKFSGFAITNSTDGNPINVQFTGIVSGFTGLSEGEKYYVQDTAGTIGTSIGTLEILVGVAISETELLIQKGKRRASGNGGSLGTASGSLAITCGFRISSVKIFAQAASHVTASSAYLTYSNGVLSGQQANWGDDANEYVNTGVTLQAPGTAFNVNYMTFSITSITDTGFTITWTETGTFNPNSAYFHWEAEGEL